MILQTIKLRYGIIGNSPELDRALEIAIVVAPTDLSVMITGESGSGKEVMGKIIHENSARKHGPFHTVNCGAIPEGTIDSELFGHEKGSFTGAHEARKGYFEQTDKGTIFLDEVGELPLSTQVRLLRVLETGEFIRVGSSKSQRTSVRVVAATNVNMWQAVQRGKFREDLYYRLNAIPIMIPPLRDRSEDIHLLFRKFAADSAERYRINEAITLTPDALQLLTSYRWPGNVRQLRNIVEQMNVIEKEEREIDSAKLRRYLPNVDSPLLPAIVGRKDDGAQGPNERDLLFALIAQLREEVNSLRAALHGDAGELAPAKRAIAPSYGKEMLIPAPDGSMTISMRPRPGEEGGHDEEDVEDTEVEESLSLVAKEKELIQKAIQKHHGRRKHAARELGISERTLYRKIKEYDLS